MANQNPQTSDTFTAWVAVTSQLTAAQLATIATTQNGVADGAWELTN